MKERKLVYKSESFYKQLLICYYCDTNCRIVGFERFDMDGKQYQRLAFEIRDISCDMLTFILKHKVEKLNEEQFAVAKKIRKQKIDEYFIRIAEERKAKKEPKEDVKKEPKKEVKKEPKDNNILEQLKDKSDNFEDMLDSFLKESESNNNKKDKKKRGR